MSADLWPVPNSGYTGLAFAATDVGYGANLFYYVRNAASGLAMFGTLNPTPGGIATDRYTVGTNCDSLVYVPSAVSSWGTGIFAYLRHATIAGITGSVIGTIDPVTKVATDRLILGTNYLNALTFTATDVGYGPNLFYYLRPASALVATNLTTTFTTNLVTTLVTNTVTSYLTNSLVTFTPTNTVTAIGMDLCLDRTVVAAANCLGPIAGGAHPTGRALYQCAHPDRRGLHPVPGHRNRQILHRAIQSQIVRPCLDESFHRARHRQPADHHQPDLPQRADPVLSDHGYPLTPPPRTAPRRGTSLPRRRAPRPSRPARPVGSVLPGPTARAGAPV